MAKSSLPGVNEYKDNAVSKPMELPNQPPSNFQADCHVSKVVDVRMTGTQAIKFKSILRHLEDSGAKLSDGSFVNNKRRAALWLIENYNI